MAGYSGTPLEKKLGVVGKDKVAVLDGPTDLHLDVATSADVAAPPYDVILWFTRSRADLEARFADLGARIRRDGGALWVCWPKKASRVPTDVSEGSLREVGLPLGLVDVKVCAVDERWSGLKFVWRKAVSC